MKVIHNLAEGRFEVQQDKELAGLFYRLHGKALMIMHTEVPKAMSGQHIGSQLIKAMIKFAKAENLHLIVYCPFVKGYLNKHPELKEGLKIMMAK